MAPYIWKSFCIRKYMLCTRKHLLHTYLVHLSKIKYIYMKILR